MARSQIVVAAGIACTLVCQMSHAWGPDGHHTVGALADKLIVGTHAEAQVKAILGGTLSLANAAVWADCAKGVNPKTFVYSGGGKFPECKIFETTTGEAEMSDFVQRNSTCVVKPGEEACNKQYHYTDVNIAQSKYKPGLVGTRDDDIVAAVSAAAHFLKGDPVPAPFSFKDKHEALLALSHYVGDIHQPLHVGTVYLSAAGKRVDPDKSGFDPKTFTTGGNDLTVSGSNMHSRWDAIPASLMVTKITAAWVTRARNLPATSGALSTWSTRWVTDTLGQAKSAYQGVTFGPLKAKHWPATLPSGYSARMSSIKKTQLTAGGAHLATLLEAIWP
jgi:S1/P1 Nuclease